MHLVVQFQILIWVGQQPWNFALKFALYVVGALLVLVPTYHLLVRPTWLGWLLAGRRHPIRGSVAGPMPAPMPGPSLEAHRAVAPAPHLGPQAAAQDSGPIPRQSEPGPSHSSPPTATR
jgi:hypothetical protein